MTSGGGASVVGNLGGLGQVEKATDVSSLHEEPGLTAPGLVPTTGSHSGTRVSL